MSNWQLQPPAKSGTDYGSTSSFLSLRENPASYPGMAPDHDYIYRQGRVWRLALRAGERVSKARIVWTDSEHRSRRTPLTNALLRWGAAELTQRIPVLAIGSNAYPRQLFDKLSGILIDDSIPAVCGELANIEIVFCPYRSTWGYIPVTPRHRHGARTKAFLQLLSTAQLREIVLTERAYSLVALPSSLAPFRIGSSGDVLSQVYIFWHDASLATFGELPAIWEGTALDADSAEVRPRVMSHAALLASLAATPVLPGTPNPLPAGASRVDPAGPLATYGQTSDQFSEQPGGFAVGRTGPIRPSTGDTDILAIVDAADRERLALGRYATAFVVTGGAGDASASKRILAVPVRVITADEAKVALPARQMALDQTARVAIGVWPGEEARLAPLRMPLGVRIARAVGAMFGVRSLAARVVPAATVMERRICWADEGALKALGIDEGGEVVVTAARHLSGRPTPQFELRTRRLQALLPSSDQIAGRIALLHPEDPDARFPDAGEILGVYPDLPWIWVDAHTRSVLGLTEMHSTGCVVVWPSVSYLLFRTGSRFTLATLGIGAAVSVAVHRVLMTIASGQMLWRLPVADVAAIGVLALTTVLATVVILANAKRR